MILSVGLSGCTEQKTNGENGILDERFIGTWYNESAPLTRTTFYSNGTYGVNSHPSVQGTWKIVEGILIVEQEPLLIGNPTIYEYEFTFSENDNKLFLSEKNFEITSTVIKDTT